MGFHKLKRAFRQEPASGRDRDIERDKERETRREGERRRDRQRALKLTEEEGAGLLPTRSDMRILESRVRVQKFEVMHSTVRRGKTMMQTYTWVLCGLNYALGYMCAHQLWSRRKKTGTGVYFHCFSTRIFPPLWFPALSSREAFSGPFCSSTVIRILFTHSDSFEDAIARTAVQAVSPPKNSTV